jgi:hypothetical protein
MDMRSERRVKGVGTFDIAPNFELVTFLPQ